MRPTWAHWVLAESAVVVAFAGVSVVAGWSNVLGDHAATLSIGLALLAAAWLLWARPSLGPRQELDARVQAGVLAIIVAGSLGLRSWPYLGNSVPLGYDYGFYKVAFDAYEGALPLGSQPTWMEQQFEPALPALHAVLAGVAGLDSVTHLTVLFPFLTALLPVVVFVVLRPAFGPVPALAGAAMMAASATLGEAYAYLYGKNLMAVALLIGGLGLLQQGRVRTAALLLGALGLWQRPTFLVAALAAPLAVLPDLVRVRSWRAAWPWIAAAGVAVAVFAPVWLAWPDAFVGTGASVAQQSVETVTAQGTAPASTGTFYGLPEYWVRALLYAPLGVAGIALAWRHPAVRPWAAAAAVSLLYVVLELPLHNRFLVMLDVAAVVLAVVVLLAWAGSARRVAWVAGALVALALVPAVAQLQEPSTPHRWVSEEQRQAIFWMQDLPDDAVFLGDNLRAPYLYADGEHLTYGPGLFDDPHTRAEWTRFWQGGNDTFTREFLAPYGSEIYLYQLDEGSRTWARAVTHEPLFALVHEQGGARVWHYTGGSP